MPTLQNHDDDNRHNTDKSPFNSRFPHPSIHFPVSRFIRHSTVPWTWTSSFRQEREEEEEEQKTVKFNVDLYLGIMLRGGWLDDDGKLEMRIIGERHAVDPLGHGEFVQNAHKSTRTTAKKPLLFLPGSKASQSPVITSTSMITYQSIGSWTCDQQDRQKRQRRWCSFPPRQKQRRYWPVLMLLLAWLLKIFD